LELEQHRHRVERCGMPLALYELRTHAPHGADEIHESIDDVYAGGGHAGPRRFRARLAPRDGELRGRLVAEIAFHVENLAEADARHHPGKLAHGGPVALVLPCREHHACLTTCR